MNNKGFTVVELLASFTLTMIIVVFLFEIVLELKDVYSSDSIKTKIITQNSLIATALNKKFEKGIYESNCDTNICTVNNRDYQISVSDNKVIIGDQTFSFPTITTIKLDDEKYQCKSFQMDGNAYIKIAYVVDSSYLKKPIKFSYTYSYH